MLHLAGAVLVTLGLLLSIAIVRAFGSAGTQVSPYRTTTLCGAARCRAPGGTISRGEVRARHRDYVARVPRWLGMKRKVVRTEEAERDAD
jgi:hypothetical protein